MEVAEEEDEEVGEVQDEMEEEEEDREEEEDEELKEFENKILIKTYQCLKCTYKTIRKSDLSRHLKVRHSLYTNLGRYFKTNTIQQDEQQQQQQHESSSTSTKSSSTSHYNKKLYLIKIFINVNFVYLNT
jgi:hypothetical protein